MTSLSLLATVRRQSSSQERRKESGVLFVGSSDIPRDVNDPIVEFEKLIEIVDAFLEFW